ncbi:T9SS type A sorting domain-containing protein [Panacibacter sp. DH6]|uniref:T9SS type A sorting domain-containing protein n=1 Tax=Panacibacter microcysteis TaxID=2793269 RepID=A0A931E5I2_9BACT|nr:T9SS type A sorting domain-containing protein [Panacibacter microcysteis]MBG9374784.1 T9SS type A sorting domain-containing protein [Panacibacter microcysteis]
MNPNLPVVRKSLYTLLLLLFAITVQAQPGTPDITFGINGTVLTKVYEKRPSTALSIAMQGPDKIIIGGAIDFSDHLRNAVLIRYNLNGTVDSTFGKNGIVLHTSIYSSTSDDRFRKIEVLQNGKILALEETDDMNFDYQFNVIRYNPEGTIDSTFGTNGIFSSRMNIEATEIHTADNGDIFVGGYIEKGKDSVGCMIQKLKPTGLPDSGFGKNGLLLIIEKEYLNRAYSFAIQKDGKFIIAGDSRPFWGLTQSFIMRVNTDGSVDSSFGINGIVKEDYITPHQIKTDNYNNYYITGSYDYGYLNQQVIVAKYNASGKPFTNFGTDGKFLFNTNNSSSYGTSLFVQKDNTLMIAGVISPYQKSGCILKLLADGSFDQSFGQSGIVINDSATFYDAILQPDNKITTAGEKMSETPFSIKQFVTLTRYNNDIVLPIILLSFKGFKELASVTLSWQLQTSSYTTCWLEHSKNGTDYLSLYSAENKNTGGQILSYTYNDRNNSTGKNFYRLKLIDESGKTTYSEVLDFMFNENTLPLIYPNPANGYINVSVAKKSSFTINDQLGKQVLKGYLNGSDKVNIQYLKPGIYYLRIAGDKSVTTTRFVKLN